MTTCTCVPVSRFCIPVCVCAYWCFTDSTKAHIALYDSEKRLTGFRLSTPAERALPDTRVATTLRPLAKDGK